MITVLGRRSSSNVQAVMWCLAELDLTADRKDAGFTYGVVDTPNYLAMNPNGKIPTLIDGDNPPVWETGAILRYLANRYAPNSFWPDDIILRTKIDQWAEWSKVNIAIKFIAPIFQKLVRTAPSKRDHKAIEQALVILNAGLDIAEQQLGENDYLAANTLTLADIQLGHVLYRYFDLDIKRPERPNLKRYYGRLCSRSAYAENVMVSYDELRIKD